MRATHLKIFKQNLVHNINEIKRNVKNNSTNICISVKADGYGCGAVTVAKTAVECGINNLAVATVEEGRELRDAGITCNIFLYSPCAKDEVADAVNLSLIPFVFDKDDIDLFDKAAGKIGKTGFPVHLAVDTGMGRIGCFPNEAAKMAKKISSKKNLVLGGMCTHFAVADSTARDDIAYTKSQFSVFMQAVISVRESGINPGTCHCAASAALLAFPEMQMDMVRPGIITYGYYPDKINADYLKKNGIRCALKPVAALRTQVATVRDFCKGKSVSYGRTWKASKPTKIATLPIGYADGLLRRFSPGLQVAIGGKNFPVIGRICMDQCMVEVDDSVKKGDEVLIFGTPESGALQTAQNIADATGTISYEIMTSISKRVPRVIC